MTQEKEKHFTEITRGMRDIYLKKNSDYGDSFSKSLDEFGQVAFIVRASDKMERMKSLHVRSQVVDDESLEDTVRDLANYCVMFLMWKQMKDYKDKKVKEKNIELPDKPIVATCGCGRFVGQGGTYTIIDDKYYCSKCRP